MKLPGMAVLFITLVAAAMPVPADTQDATPSLSLEQIMADPDWMGNAPQKSYWGADNNTVYYQQKRRGSELLDLFEINLNEGSTRQVPESEWSRHFHSSITYNLARDVRAYVYADDIYLADDNGVRQITRTSAVESAPMFMHDGRRIAFERDGQVFVHDPVNGLTEQVTDIRFADDPDKDEDFDVLKSHQQRIYSTLQKTENDREEARQRSPLCQDTVLLVQRLIELEKENFEIAIYPLDAHGFTHPASWLDEYRRIFKLFEAHLK